MKATNSDMFSAKAITLAVQGALLVMFAAPLVARADDVPNAEVTALTKPTNSVEVGAEYVPQNSAKFGEYNGLDKKGTYLIGNFDLRGGDGTKRVEIKGTDLGTTSREFGLDVSDQGKWNFGFGYDELRHNITNTYQTPFQGAIGGNSFTLPQNFGFISTTTKPAGYTTAPSANDLTPAQLRDFNTPEVYSQRESSKFNAGFVFDSNWNVKFDMNHLQQTGAKLQGVSGDPANGFGTAAGQTPFVIMTPTNYTTDTVNLALNWAGDKGYATASYYGSIFQDAYNNVTFQNPFNSTASLATGTLGTIPTDMVSTMPSNEFHQVNLNGGYGFTSTTKLVGGVSYARNTQNDSYAQDAMSPGNLPQTSLQGAVVTTNANAKLTNQTTKDLQLSASFKYNKRDNQTASNTYNFYTIGDAGNGTGTTNVNTTVNAPMSNAKTQFDLDADYRIDKNQKVNLAYGYEGIQRSCDGVNYPLVSPKTSTTGFVSPFTATTCAEVPDSNENKITATYKLKASEDLNFNAGVGYANRVAEINPLFYNPMQTTGASGGAYGAGYEFQQFMSYMDASRRQDILKLGANWQANDKFSFGFKGNYNLDSYGSEYGVQNGRSYSLNLDATYAATEHSSFSAYATSQNKTRDMTSLQALAAANENTTTGVATSATKLSSPANATWSNTLTEKDLTIGVGAKQGGFMDNKLDLTGDLTYSLDKTSYDTELGYAGVTTGGLTCSSAQFMTCGALPDIKSDMLQLKLAGTYRIDNVSKVRVGYLFQRLNATDFMYNTYQYGSAPANMMPTNQQAPSYSVNVVSVSYALNF